MIILNVYIDSQHNNNNNQNQIYKGIEIDGFQIITTDVANTNELYQRFGAELEMNKE